MSDSSNLNAALESRVRDTLAKQGQSFRPEALANALGISGKVVRSYLRSTFERPAEAKGTSWALNLDEATATIVYFKTHTNAADATQTVKLSD